MLSATLIGFAIAATIAFLPTFLIGRLRDRRAHDESVPSPGPRAEVVRNASIAYSLRAALFVPLLALGAMGDVRTPLVAALCIAFGLCLMSAVRARLLGFAEEALLAGQAITVHAFIAARHRADEGVRRLAASLTVVGLVALLIVESLAVTAFVAPIIGERVAAAALVGSLVILAVLPTLLGAHSGVMHASQLMLGVTYLGLSGATVALLYRHLSALTPMSAAGTLALVFVGSLSVILLCAKRSRYVDNPAHSASTRPDRPLDRAAFRVVGRFGKIVNIGISTLLVLVLVLVSMDLFRAGRQPVLDALAAAARAPMLLPTVGVVALCLLALCHPLVDNATWQAVAALVTRDVEPAKRSATLRSVFRAYAVDSSLLWLWMAALGAIALLAMQPPSGADIVHAIVARMATAGDAVTDTALGLLTMAVFAMAVSTMSMQCSALIFTLREDMLSHSSGARVAFAEVDASRRPYLVRALLVLVVVGGVGVALALAEIPPVGERLLAWLIAAGSAQLALLPLVAAAIVRRSGSLESGLAPGWALIVLGSGALAAVGAVALYVITGSDAWLWTTAPACLAAGGIASVAAHVASMRS